MYKFVLVLFALGGASFIYNYVGYNYSSQKVIARVSLTTNCELDPRAFAVKNIQSGEIREFQHGEAFIKAQLADELMIVLSEKFEQVSFEGEVVKAAPKLVVFQDCTEPVGLAGIFKSFNEQFSAN